ncbi:hypothetical protein CONPUDRAFT_46168 [Coniophora puteana RWD-64-598 SS2]|uniref:Myb-like domain-containing protein n=1 Tax=Coniophora puteana (strain RWD-64-598) TaxID=741705 RepID=A0A5M3N6K0_CONPW|nr:uncharacterized protein CONPUDRAFT_46168 [Coniophora puteana RWD-64-598 SS2]EIW87062.1 hypothetical protein CONPUDRAFT_46168 [Coniophora puteana RWD-64-598 SS2]
MIIPFNSQPTQPGSSFPLNQVDPHSLVTTAPYPPSSATLVPSAPSQIFTIPQPTLISGADNTSFAVPQKRRKHSRESDAPRKGRKPGGSSKPTFDPIAEAGEEIDPSVVTMATLCDDTGQGRISTKAAQVLSSYGTWKKSNRDKRARMRVTMEAKKYGRQDDENANGSASQPSNPSSVVLSANGDGVDSTPDPSTQSSSADPSSNEGEEAPRDKNGNSFDYSQNLSTSQYNVQIRIGPNGETIIDEESLFVDRNAEDDSADYTHVEESDLSKFVNSGTYGKRYRGSRWSAEETELFYDALSQFGENYELISYVLPGRDRKACKNKFRAEDKRNPLRINHCLNNRVPYDMQTLSRMTGKDFSGPTPEIRAPVLQTLSDPPPEERLETTPAEASRSSRVRKKSKTPNNAAEVEVLGDVASFDDNES